MYHVTKKINCQFSEMVYAVETLIKTDLKFTIFDSFL